MEYTGNIQRFEESLFKTPNSLEEIMTSALPINNYLKTPEEIDAEFGIRNTRTEAIVKNVNDWKSGSTKKIKRDGYTDIHDLDVELSGFMEENY